METKNYECPKCGGSDLYLGQTRVIKGIGGIWGNRQAEVLKPYCRSCDIEAVRGREGNLQHSKQVRKNNVLLAFGSILLLFAGTIFLSSMF